MFWIHQFRPEHSVCTVCSSYRRALFKTNSVLFFRYVPKIVILWRNRLTLVRNVCQSILYLHVPAVVLFGTLAIHLFIANGLCSFTSGECLARSFSNLADAGSQGFKGQTGFWDACGWRTTRALLRAFQERNYVYLPLRSSLGTVEITFFDIAKSAQHYHTFLPYGGSACVRMHRKGCRG